MNNQSEFLVEIQIQKISDGCPTPKLIASPKISCTPGEPVQFIIGSEDQPDCLSIQVMIPNNTSQPDVHASILMKENNQIVLSLKNDIKMQKAI